MANVSGHEYLAGLVSRSGDESAGNLQTASQRVRFHQRRRPMAHGFVQRDYAERIIAQKAEFPQPRPASGRPVPVP
jgi:hypothetical protein